MACRIKLHTNALYTALKQSDHLSNPFLSRVAPTLAEVLQHCPIWLGINIEIKYPLEPESEFLGFTPPYEINSYLDHLLDVIYAYGGERRIILTCFHPDVVAALRLKQVRYPIGMIHCGGEPTYYRDRRTNEMTCGIAYALIEPCDLFVVNSTPLFHIDPNHPSAKQRSTKRGGATAGGEIGWSDQMIGLKYIRRMRQSNAVTAAAGYTHTSQHPNHRLSFLTWGDMNSISWFVEVQRSPAWSVDGIIQDNCGDLILIRNHKTKTKSKSHLILMQSGATGSGSGSGSGGGSGGGGGDSLFQERKTRSFFAPSNHIDISNINPAHTTPIPTAASKSAATKPKSSDPLRFKLELTTDSKLSLSRPSASGSAAAGSGGGGGFGSGKESASGNGMGWQTYAAFGLMAVVGLISHLKRS